MSSPEETGRALWAQRVREAPDRPFLGWEGRTWTFAELDADVRRLAAGLAELGVGRETRVLSGLSNRAETVMTQLALQVLGAVHVPLLGGLGFDELAYQMGHCGARVLIADGAVAEVVFPRLGECPAIAQVVSATGERPDGAVGLDDLLASDALELEPLPGYDDRSLLAILYTSGSTGRPKGVMLPAGSFYSCGAGFVGRFGIRADDNYILPVPLAHATGALSAQSMTIHAGCRLTVVDRFSPSAFWQQAAETGSTVSILFPAQLNLLLEVEKSAPPPGPTPLRLVITHAWNERFRDAFGVELATVWGMTETGALCVGSDAGENGGEGFIGVPMEGVEVKVADHSLSPVPLGSTGEICLKHRHVMLGYLADEEATVATLTDGWVRSGDIGLEREGGRFFFAGRLKNLIKRSGENVSGEEVEAALDEHPLVAESLVFGVPDRLRTEEVAALVVVVPGSEPDPAEIVGSLTDRLARWKLPRYVTLSEEPLPRLGNGKIDRMRAKAMFDPAGAWDGSSARSAT